MANSVDPDQTAPIGAVCAGSKLFASILNSSVMLIGNYLQQATSADDFFLGALRANISIICITGILAYSVDTDKMLQNLAYHQDLHCLIEYKNIQDTSYPDKNNDSTQMTVSYQMEEFIYYKG